MFPVVFMSWAEFHSSLKDTLVKVSQMKSWTLQRAKNALPSGIFFVKNK